MIDPSVWQSEDYGRLGMLAKLVFIGLFSNADDAGRGRAKAAYIKSLLFPYDEEITVREVDHALTEIAAYASITFYSHDQNEYYSLTHWHKWQKIDKPSASILPAPEEQGNVIRRAFDEPSPSPRGGLAPNRKEEKRKEEKGGEGNVRACAREEAGPDDSGHDVKASVSEVGAREDLPLDITGDVMPVSVSGTGADRHNSGLMPEAASPIAEVKAQEQSDLDAFDEGLRAVVKDWFSYKAEKNQAYHATGRKSLLAEIQKHVPTHGSAAVINVIRQSMGSNYQGIVWDWLTQQKNKERSPPVHQVTQQRYQQRDYDLDDFSELKRYFGIPQDVKIG